MRMLSRRIDRPTEPVIATRMLSSRSMTHTIGARIHSKMLQTIGYAGSRKRISRFPPFSGARSRM